MKVIGFSSIFIYGVIDVSFAVILGEFLLNLEQDLFNQKFTVGKGFGFQCKEVYFLRGSLACLCESAYVRTHTTYINK